MSDYIFALLFGAGIVVFFAWDQFNRPSYEDSRELTRLVELLKPERMRKRTVYWRAYASYTAILLLIYFTLCAYGLLLGPAIGFEVPGYPSEADDAPDVGAREIPVQSSGYDPERIEALPQRLSGARDAGAGTCTGFTCDPTVPLFVSLVMVGLAPSFPMLVRVEKRIRLAAHRLSGIPTRLIAGSRRLRERPIRLQAGPETLLIPLQDWRRLEHYGALAGRHLDDPDGFRMNISEIFALRSWVLQEKLPLANHAARDGVAEIDAGVRKSVERLVFTLDTLSGFEGAGGLPPDGLAAEQARLAWDAAAKEVDQVCADLCVLVMLYVEHGVLPTAIDTERVGWGAGVEADDPDYARQTRRAESILLTHLSDAARFVERENLGMVLWVRATAVALLVALVYGMLLGRDTAADASQSLSGGNWIGLGFLFLMSAALTYALALLVAISWRQTAYQSGAWRNPFRDNWSLWAPQLLTVALLSGLASLICVVGSNIVATVQAVGIELVLEKRVAVLVGAIRYNGPVALLGATLALVVILIVDAWRGGRRGAAWLDRIPWMAGIAMFLAGVGSRLMMTEAGATKDRLYNLLCRAAEDASTRFKPAFEGQSLTDACVKAVWMPALSAGALAATIGLFVALFVRGTLVHEFSRVQDDIPSPLRPPPQPAQAAE